MDQYHETIKAETFPPQAVDEQAVLSTDASMNNKQVAYQESSKAQQKNGDEDTSSHELPKDLTWQQSSISGGSFSFACSNCKEKYCLQTAQFASEAPDSMEDLTSTGRRILWGKTGWGQIVAFLAAITVALIVALITGKAGTSMAIFGAGVYLILKPVLVRKFMKRLPVWSLKCRKCGQTSFVASDGTEACIAFI